MPPAKHLFLVANYPPDAQWSMRIYADLVQAAAEGGGWRVTRLTPREWLAKGRDTNTGFAKLLGYADKYLLAPVQFLAAQLRARARKDAPALVHIADHSNAVYAPLFAGLPVVVTCHDVIAIRRARGEFPGGRTGFTGRLQQRWILRALGRVRHFIFDSEASRRDLARLLDRDFAGEPVIFPPLGQPLAPVPPEEARRRLTAAGLAISGPFLFHHGNASWYKNREQVLRVFAQISRECPDLHLVCSGGDLNAEQTRQIAAEGLESRVHAPGSVSLEVLAALYSRTAVFFFPSWVEGFGWPPVEAQACGCPVVASNAGSLAEVLADSALTAAPDDEATLARHVRAVLSDPALAADLRRRGHENVARFDRTEMEQKCLAAYDAVARAGNP